MYGDLFRRLDSLADSDSAFEIELIQIFLSELEKNLATLNRVTQSGDLEAAARESHSLKGSALNIGATRFSELSEQLEKSLQNGSDNASLREALSEEYHSLSQVLNARVKTLQSGP